MSPRRATSHGAWGGRSDSETWDEVCQRSDDGGDIRVDRRIVALDLRSLTGRVKLFVSEVS